MIFRKPLKVSLTAIAVLGAAAIPTLATAQSAAADYMSAARYDVLGRTVGTIAPDPDGTGPLKHGATRTTYDTAGRPIKVETGELAVWKSETTLPSAWGADFSVFTTAETTYDGFGRKLTETVKGSDNVAIGLTQYSYDNLGRLECTAVRMNPATYGSLPASACTLGTAGNDGADRITKSLYDDVGQVLQLRKAVGTSAEVADVTYSYTDNGQIEHVVDANGNKAKLEYDGFDRQSKWIFPSKAGATGFNKATPATALSTAGALNTADYEQYTYDKNGNRLTHRKRDGSTLSFTYDALNRMTVKAVPARVDLESGQTRDVYYRYDLRGLQTSARFDSNAGKGSISVYDGYGRQISSTDTMSGQNRTLTYQYDDNGNRTRLTHPDGKYWQLEYDGLNRADRLRENAGQIGVMSYTARGSVKELEWPYGSQGSASTPAYDNAGRTISLAHDLRATAGDVTFGYGYIPSGQLSYVSRTNETYAWDGHSDLATRSYTINGLNQYENAGSASFCYDANGNLTADGGSVYLYDIENRLVEKRVQGTGNTNCAALSYTGTRLAKLTYDPLGRLSKVKGDGPGNTRFLYDGDAMVMEYSSTGTILRRYVHGTNADADDPLIWYEGSAVGPGPRKFLHANHQGSIIAVTDFTGNLLNANTYDEYGIGGSTNANPNAGRFQYTGQAWLEELGMYYYKARIYSPTLGRFLQTDPIGYEDTFNLYAYVGNDPVNGTDSTGLAIDIRGDPCGTASGNRATSSCHGSTIGSISGKEATHAANGTSHNTSTTPPKTTSKPGLGTKVFCFLGLCVGTPEARDDLVKDKLNSQPAQQKPVETPRTQTRVNHPTQQTSNTPKRTVPKVKFPGSQPNNTGALRQIARAAGRQALNQGGKLLGRALLKSPYVVIMGYALGLGPGRTLSDGPGPGDPDYKP